jgi:hypothetical protein
VGHTDDADGLDRCRRNAANLKHLMCRSTKRSVPVLGILFNPAWVRIVRGVLLPSFDDYPVVRIQEDGLAGA